MATASFGMADDHNPGALESGRADPSLHLRQGSTQTEAQKVNEVIYKATGFGNTFMVVTDQGNVIVDTSLEAMAPHHKKLLTAVSDGPVHSVIITHDDLARWIRRDFPHYRIDASVIKNINTPKKLAQALELYDEVVLPMTSNEDLPFLESIADKSRITLFANAGCAFTCPART